MIIFYKTTDKLVTTDLYCNLFLLAKEFIKPFPRIFQQVQHEFKAIVAAIIGIGHFDVIEVF